MSILLWMIIGAVVGWMAHELMDGYEFGLKINVIIAISGATVGAALIEALGLSAALTLIVSILMAVIGAISLLSAADSVLSPTIFDNVQS